MIEYPQGTPSWVELGSPDQDASARFYGELLGWQAAAAEPAEETGGYRLFTLGGKQVAGLGRAQEGTPAAWVSYVATGDAEAARERVEAAGGATLMEPVAVMDFGTMAIFADAAGGAVFGVWQPGRHRGAELVNAHGALTMNELDTREVDAAERFYGDVFGWTLDRIGQGGELVYGGVRLDGRLVAGLLPMGEAFPAEVPAHWRPYFGVEDLDASTERVAGLGGRVVSGPTAVPNGRFAAVLDPQGASFSLLEAPYDPPPG